MKNLILAFIFLFDMVSAKLYFIEVKYPLTVSQSIIIWS